MKKLKNFLSILIIAAIVLTSTGISIASTEQVDPNGSITMPEDLNKGKGYVDLARSVSANYKMYAQLQSIDEGTYETITKINDELRVYQAYNLYKGTEESAPQQAEQIQQLKDEFNSTQASYKEKYGNEVDTTGDVETKINEDLSIKDNLLLSKVHYNNNDWKEISQNEISVNLADIEGTKPIAVWVKLESNGTTIYDAEVYKVNGTKQASTNNNENNNSNINGQILDPNDNIKIDNQLKNGEGQVDITGVSNYKLYAQILLFDQDTYKQVKQIEDELRVYQAYNLYKGTEESAPQQAEQIQQLKDEFNSTQASYKEKYGNEVDTTGDVETKINEDLSIRNTLMLQTPYKEEAEWTELKNNIFNIDLSQISGTKDTIVWVKLVKEDGTAVYDGQVFEITGTKSDDNNNTKPDDNNNTKPDDNNNTKPDDNNNTKPDDNNNTKPDDNNNTKPDDNNNTKPDNNNNTKPDNNNSSKSDDNNSSKQNDSKADSNSKSNGTNSSSSNSSSKGSSSSKSSNSTPSKTDTTTTSAKIPYTGSAENVTVSSIVAIIATAALAIIFFIKYKTTK